MTRRDSLRLLSFPYVPDAFLQHRDNGKDNGTRIAYWGNIGVREKEMETAIEGLGFNSQN